ncbi:hypothetical protein C7954_15010 [Halanaerobium congolense]|jgi:hypothetical protein|uniref:PD-(D/E)XK nuclease superfamily protein n=1 Tax=Halanaerobium congolense TaxID=54121 RepID=A0A318DY29_9FIRM|nr:hypothetical protein [Halanaerobium congolense]PXV62132.1 hypothetical protein C8C78_1383 [Halanaerobium congolense]TDX36429.1 hypothetical protein C7954_15010 [Halanaerobium congolense]
MRFIRLIIKRTIDLVLIIHKNEIVSIEFKLKYWKQVIKQALDHKNGADRAYICIPKPTMGFNELYIK